MTIDRGMEMARISAQLSVYPLRQPRLSPVIDEAVRICRDHVRSGPMSTWVSGDNDTVFEALKDTFCNIATAGEVVMVINACPALGATEGE